MIENNVNKKVIQLKRLTKKYDTLTAVDHLDLNIEKGEIFGLLGPNGAGKSTTILMMLGLSEPTSGEAYVCDINVKRQPTKVKEKVGYLPDNVGFYDNMTALENLLFIAQLNKRPLAAAKEDALHLLERVGLTEAIHKKVGKFSRGMIQRLGLADVLIKNPEVIILDEPTLGIDPKGVAEFLDLIMQLSKEESITVLISSHHLHQVQKICDRVGIFVKGKLIAEGDLNSLSKKLISGNPYLIEAKINPNQQDKIAKLREHLLVREDIRSIHQDKELLAINCLKDLSSTISKEIISHDIDLIGLAKKEYGLDEIYQSYFENEEKLS
ncbi:MAG TPA: ABC transporter ATP-binding protein [Chitinophagaceae bacterium]|nr:ABC transporter ATP-binding protein [Chitinophagaceae bacterium]